MQEYLDLWHLLQMSDLSSIFDVVILGAGGAGCAAAIEARQITPRVLLVTNGSFQESKTSQAQGGIQAAFGENDSPEKHADDTLRTGQHANDPKLVRIMAESARETIHWLESLGVVFNKKDGSYVLQTAAGLSEPRVLSAGDMAGKGIMAALIRETQRVGIAVKEHSAVHHISKSDGSFQLTLRAKDQVEALILHARSVVIATGGFMPREKAGGYSSSTKSETPDGITLAESLGATVVCPDLVQYHPTGVILPRELRRVRLPETMRSAGAVLLNRQGREFTDSLMTRNDLTQAIVEECRRGNGVDTDDGRRGVWLDTPRLDQINGSGFTRTHYPTFVQMFLDHGHDITQHPVLVYPILHYSLGGINIDEHCETTVPGCFAAGEITWGVHGKERLMGNSLLDIFVFGRIAGKNAAQRATNIRHG